ncbi:MAG: hypothetical protein M1825_004850 [Sarcosagium campestre]|nr:MAG: hypothetical protein M1825_004850 [Sarcosagium campestre]
MSGMATDDDSLGCARITFSTPSPKVVDKFFAAALRSGGLSYQSPSLHDPDTEDYSSTVLDQDGNLIKAVYRVSQPSQRTTTDRPQSVLTWQKDVACSLIDDATQAEETHLPDTTTARQTTVVMPGHTSPHNPDLGSSKALIGTLLGAAGGAAVAYAMMKAEAKDEALRTPRTQISSGQTITMIDRTLENASNAVSNTGFAQAEQIAPAPATSQIGSLISTFLAPPPAAPAQHLIASAAPTVNGSPQSNTGTNSTVKVARNIPLPPPSTVVGKSSRRSTATLQVAPSSSSTSKRSKHSSTVSTLRAARATPLPPSATMSALTLAPSDSISNAASTTRSRHSRHQGSSVADRR